VFGSATPTGGDAVLQEAGSWTAVPVLAALAAAAPALLAADVPALLEGAALLVAAVAEVLVELPQPERARAKTVAPRIGAELWIFIGCSFQSGWAPSGTRQRPSFAGWCLGGLGSALRAEVPANGETEGGGRCRTTRRSG
jgi:hypothetical protein